MRNQVSTVKESKVKEIAFLLLSQVGVYSLSYGTYPFLHPLDFSFSKEIHPAAPAAPISLLHTLHSLHSVSYAYLEMGEIQGISYLSLWLVASNNPHSILVSSLTALSIFPSSRPCIQTSK